MFNLFELPDLTPDWSMSINWSVNFILLGALIALNAHHLLKKVCFTGLLLHTFGFFIAVVDWMDYALLYTQSTIALSVLFTILLMALSDAGNRNHRCNQTRTYVLRLLSNPGKA